MRYESGHRGVRVIDRRVVAYRNAARDPAPPETCHPLPARRPIPPPKEAVRRPLSSVSVSPKGPCTRPPDASQRSLRQQVYLRRQAWGCGAAKCRHSRQSSRDRQLLYEKCLQANPGLEFLRQLLHRRCLQPHPRTIKKSPHRRPQPHTRWLTQTTHPRT